MLLHVMSPSTYIIKISASSRFVIPKNQKMELDINNFFRIIHIILPGRISKFSENYYLA